MVKCASSLRAASVHIKSLLYERHALHTWAHQCTGHSTHHTCRRGGTTRGGGALLKPFLAMRITTACTAHKSRRMARATTSAYTMSWPPVRGALLAELWSDKSKRRWEGESPPCKPSSAVQSTYRVGNDAQRHVHGIVFLPRSEYGVLHGMHAADEGSKPDPGRVESL